jgi:tetratricopeptide (TPR) repeat protein
VWIACLVGASVLSSPAHAEEGTPAATPAPAAPATTAPASTPEVWHTETAKAIADAATRNVRILAIVTQDFYPSDPCVRLLASIDDPATRAARDGLVLLRVNEGKALPFSTERKLEGEGHPYTALLEPSGAPVSVLRGAWTATAWAEKVTRLRAAATRWDAARTASVEKPHDAATLYELSESLRALERVQEADEALRRADARLPADSTDLKARVRFRLMEARFEDRVAVQDFDGADALLNAFERDHPNAPHRRRVALYRALVRAHRGDLDVAIAELDALAALEGDPDLAREAAEHAAAARRIKGLKN